MILSLERRVELARDFNKGPRKTFEEFTTYLGDREGVDAARNLAWEFVYKFGSRLYLCHGFRGRKCISKGYVDLSAVLFEALRYFPNSASLWANLKSLYCKVKPMTEGSDANL
jgi:hypothetical protein